MARKLMNNKSAGASGQAEMKEKIICDRCGVEMELMEVQFRYLTRDFRYKVPRCPECGQVSLTEDLVIGKMADVEAMIEEK